MTIIKKDQTKIESYGKGTVWDYLMPGEDLGISYQEHDGRVPEKGWGINIKCSEIYYVINGSAKIFINDKGDNIHKGDLVIISPGEKSYMIADNLKIVTVTQPNFYWDQYKEIE